MLQVEPSTPGASHALDERCAEALQLQAAGRGDLAEPIYRSIIELKTDHASANYGLGLLLVQQQRSAQGLPHLLAAVTASPTTPDYWLGYLEGLMQLGDTAQATDVLAVARHQGLQGAATDDIERRLLAQISRSTGVEAEAVLLETPLYAAVARKDFATAMPLARRLTERFPEHGMGWKIHAALLWSSDAPERALEAMHTAVRLLPRDAEAHANLGAVLTKLRRLEEAEQRLLHALDIDGGFAPAHSHIADTYQLQGRYDDAAASLRRAIATYPAELAAETDALHAALLFMLNHDPQIDAAQLHAEHRRVAARWDHLLPSAATRHPNDPDPERCLHIGLVSADLRDHAVAGFVEPVLRHWATRGSLNVTAYHCFATEDDTSLRLRGQVARWCPVAALSDAELAAKIAADRIDILIDLAGYTSMHRLATFAHKPAPVQVSWLGYPATTGLAAMDYYLADRHFLPPGLFERHYTEKLAYVPVVWPFQPHAAAPGVNRLPALDTGMVCFGSFNRLGKITAVTVELWSRLLCAVPTSTLMIAGVPQGGRQRRLLAGFAANGVDPGRLTFHEWSDHDALLALHHRADLALEPVPYTGCTTSNHALWMGVPPLMLAGGTPASRLCAANLGHLGLEEFIAATPEEFVAKGVYWATHLEALAALRAGLRARWLASPARDAGFVADGIEKGLRHMWRRWCAHLPPASFEIGAAELE